jgi:hypothetical protein
MFNNSNDIKIGCGNEDCVNPTYKYFCSRSCKNLACSKNFINETDISLECNLELTTEAHNRLFNDTDISLECNLELTTKAHNRLFNDIKIGCGNEDCVNPTYKYFCSRSCKNLAFRKNFINETYISLECNLELTTEAHNRLFNK